MDSIETVDNLLLEREIRKQQKISHQTLVVIQANTNVRLSNAAAAALRAYGRGRIWILIVNELRVLRIASDKTPMQQRNRVGRQQTRPSSRDASLRNKVSMENMLENQETTVLYG